MTPKLTLISHKLCPYVQRAVIALTEKGVPFERVDIDLANKPDWFLKISPLGKVPVLRVTTADGEVALFESNVICEYIEETQNGAKLHPQDPLQRAQHRAWMEFGSTILSELWGLETTGDPAMFETKRLAVAAKFARVEEALGHGAVFCGQAFQSGGRGVCADLSLFRRVRSIDRPIDLRGDAEGARMARGACEAAERSLGGRGRLSAIAACVPRSPQRAHAEAGSVNRRGRASPIFVDVFDGFATGSPPLRTHESADGGEPEPLAHFLQIAHRQFAGAADIHCAQQAMKAATANRSAQRTLASRMSR